MKQLILASVVVATGCAASLAQVEASPAAPTTRAEWTLVEPLTQVHRSTVESAATAPVPSPTLLERACAQANWDGVWSNFVSTSSVTLPTTRHDDLTSSPGPVTARELAGLEPDDCTLHTYFQQERDPDLRDSVVGLKHEMLRLHSRGTLAAVSGQPGDARAFFQKRDAFQVHFAAFKARVREAHPDVAWTCESAR